MKYPKYEDILNVKLISYTKSADQAMVWSEDHNGFYEECSYGSSLTELIAYCARVSNPSNQGNVETSDKLIDYLIQHKHWSPFEMVNVCVEVTSTRDILEQFIRHSSIRVQEYSQRYSDGTNELGFCTREYREQDWKNRQNSIEVDDPDIDRMFRLDQEDVIDLAISKYKRWISKGIAKEQARAVLPFGNTVSRLYANGCIRSWIHYLQVRRSEGVQKEHRLMAQEIGKAIAKVFPYVG